MGVLAISQRDEECSCLRAFALAGLLPTSKHLHGLLPHSLQISAQILLIQRAFWTTPSKIVLIPYPTLCFFMLLLLSHVSHVQLCVTL